MPRLSALCLIASAFLALSVGCASPTESGEPVAGEAAEQGLTVDIPQSEALLAKAVGLAERHAAGDVCEDSGNGEVLRSSIVDLLREAVAVRDTVYFRTQVIGRKAILAQELAGTVEWQEILGTFKPTDLTTLPTALATGVSLWDTSGGVYGNKARIEFHAHGQAVLFVLDIDPKTPVWKSSPTTWSYQNGTLRMGNGAVYQVKFADGILQATPAGADFPAFVSPQSECEA